MPNYVMPYDVTIETTAGHTVQFVAGEPQHVPPIKVVIDEVQMRGGKPEEDAKAPAKAPAKAKTLKAE